MIILGIVIAVGVSGVLLYNLYKESKDDGKTTVSAVVVAPDKIESPIIDTSHVLCQSPLTVEPAVAVNSTLKELTLKEEV